MSHFYTNVVKRNNKILVRGYKNGKRYSGRYPFSPSLFMPTNEESKWRTIHGTALKEKKFESPNHMRDFVKTYGDVDNFEYFGMEDAAYQYIYQNFHKAKYESKYIRVCYLDIEVDTEGGYPDMATADKKITAITMLYDDITIAFGYGEYETDDPTIKYIRCKNEHELIRKFIKVWSSARYGPDVVSGWNIEFFDIPYLYTRITRMFDEDMARELSPWRMFDKRTVTMFGKEQTAYYPIGIAVLDYISMYKKFVAVTKPQETYKLDHIAWVELGENKLDYSEYGSLHKLAAENHQLFMEYNIRDCRLVKRIDDKQKLMEVIYAISFSSNINFGSAMGTVAAWDVAIYSYLMDRCVIIPKKVKNDPGRPLVGGYVKPPTPGKYGWLASFDLTSLYPHIIMQYNVGPDTFIKQCPNDYTTQELIAGEHRKDLDGNIFAANSCMYSRDKTSFLSQLMKDLFNERKEVKKEMLALEQKRANGEENLSSEIEKLDTLQYAIKVRLNAAYGALGNKHFRWFDIRYAESITRGGQLAVQWAAHHVNGFMNKWLKTEEIDYIIYIDTDSIYVDMEEVVKQIGKECTREEKTEALDAFCETKIQPLLEAVYQKLAGWMAAKEQAMFMKREALADRAVFVAKKRYMINVLNNEGVQYKEPKIKILGIECVRSSTPSSCRQAIRDAIKIILQGEESELHSYVKTFRDQYTTLPLEEIARNSGCNGMDKYGDPQTIYAPKTPMQVRGALLYNHWLKKNKLTDKYETIFESDKVRYLMLRVPNPIQENVISWTGKLPDEFDIHAYIDYDTQFVKTFLDPIENILTLVDWSSEPRFKIGDFWG